MSRTAATAAAMTIAVLLAALAGGDARPAAAAEPGGGAVLDRARTGLESMTRRLASYACVETVERRYYRPPPDAALSCDRIEQARMNRAEPLTEDATDRLRLEVTLADGREIHAWPGATRFDARNVDQIIHGGLIGTGSFGAHLIGIFDNPGVVFEFAGEAPAGDRSFAQFRYRVPLAASHYRVRAGSDWQPIDYAGSFWIDTASLDLQRFTLEASRLPEASNMCRVEGSLDYHRVRIGDGDVLLPRQAQMQVVMRDGAETASVTTFGSCHEYQVESEVHFDGEPQIGSAAAPAAVHAAMPLPLGLPVVLALADPIDTDTAAVGDLVSAHIQKPVRRPGAAGVLIPAGTLVRGRITRLEHHYFPQPYFLVALSFNRLVEGDLRIPFAARYDGGADLAARLGVALRSRGGGLEYWNVGTFLFPTAKPRYVMPAGFAAKWETLAQ